jgi:hypothetical protein
MAKAIKITPSTPPPVVAADKAAPLPSTVALAPAVEAVDETVAPAPAPATHDPGDSIADTIEAVAQLYSMAGDVSASLSRHYREAAGDAQLHSRLHRVQLLCGEFRAGLQAHVLHDLSVGPHAPRAGARG